MFLLAGNKIKLIPYFNVTLKAKNHITYFMASLLFIVTFISLTKQNNVVVCALLIVSGKNVSNAIFLVE